MKGESRVLFDNKLGTNTFSELITEIKKELKMSVFYF